MNKRTSDYITRYEYLKRGNDHVTVRMLTRKLYSSINMSNKCLKVSDKRNIFRPLSASQKNHLSAWTRENKTHCVSVSHSSNAFRNWFGTTVMLRDSGLLQQNILYSQALDRKRNLDNLWSRFHKRVIPLMPTRARPQWSCSGISETETLGNIWLCIPEIFLLVNVIFF